LGQPNVEAMLSLFAICANDQACNGAYPDLQNRFQALIAQLNQQPITAEDGSLVTANTVIGALRQSDIRPGLGAYFPLMIWELERGVLDTLNAIRNNELPPLPPTDTDPVVRRYAGLEVSPDAQFLIQTALDLREESRQLDQTADRLLERGNERIELDLLGDSLAARFDLLFHEIMNNEPFDRRLALNQAYLVLPVEGTSVEDVRTFITEHFDGVNAARLMALADGMTEEDVAELAEIIFGVARDHAYFFDVSLALSLYACQEHVPYNTLDGMLAAFESLEIPQLGAAKLGTAQNLIASCQLFPTGLEPDDYHEPVTSDIPTLILLGSADTQTAISWGQHAAETLDNSQVVLFPETGHGAIRYSLCAKDIGAAFFDNPEAEINTACTVDLRPQFVLPPDGEGQP
jgi:hypothetical protein